MKRLIYGMMVVLITAISCEKNDIEGCKGALFGICFGKAFEFLPENGRSDGRGCVYTFL